MPRHKTTTVTNLPPPAPPAPRLFAQVMTAMGELVLVGIGIVGVVVIVNWLLIGFDVANRPVRHGTPPQQSPWVLRCWYDRAYRREICDAPYRAPPARRFYARDGA
jgi:hypothetical protein